MHMSDFMILFPAAALVSLPVPSHAQDVQDTIEVRASSPMQQWQARTTDALNRNLSRAPALQRGFANEAIVQVAFTVDEKGRASDLRVLPGDGNFTARRAASFAVRRLQTLASMPAQSEGRNVLANIIFYDNERSLRALEDRLFAAERERVASNGRFSDHVAIGVSPSVLDAD